jgi:two-component system, OmpR family, response regulator
VRLLVAEDDPGLRAVLVRGLERAGYVVDVTARGDDALELLLLNPYAAAVVDWRMPGMDGIDVVARARKQGVVTPVLMLTARDTPADRVAGLDAGSDDYLIKPFDFGELLARLRALLRRPATGGDPVVSFGNLHFDPALRNAVLDGALLPLTPTELAITEVLVRRAPAVASRREIALHAWPDSLADLGSNTIDVHVARLRAKLIGGGIAIEAVRSVGYRLVQR